MRNHRQRTVIVAMVAVRMMQPAVREIVDMVAMRHGFVAAVGSVAVCRIVAARVMLRIAAVRIALAHGDHMMLGVAALGMLQAAVIEIINVAFVPHGEMTASGAMNVVRSARFGCHGGSFRCPPPIIDADYAEAGRRGKEDISTLAGTS